MNVWLSIALVALSACTLLAGKIDLSYVPYMIVKVKLPDRDDLQVFIITKTEAKPIPDEETRKVFMEAGKSQRIPTIPYKEFRKLQLRPAVSSVKDIEGVGKDNQSLESWAQEQLLKSYAVQGRLTEQTAFIGQYANPSVVKFNGRLLLATGSNWGKADHRLVQRWTVTFRWLDNPRFPIPHGEEDKFCILADRTRGLNGGEIRGEDPRIVVLSDDHFNVYYTNSLIYPKERMGMASIRVNKETGCAEVEHLCSVIESPIAGRQKNWSPMIYDGEVLLVQSVNPLTIVKTKNTWENSSDPKKEAQLQVSAEVVSQVPRVNIAWPYGEVRGGTNAVPIGKGKYLAFFHSYIQRVKSKRLRTYFGGAYSFSNKMPFRLLAVSPMPIIPRKLYKGDKPEHNNLGPEIEYVFFPTSIFLDRNEVVMSAGYNDLHGLLLRLDIHRLLQTMIPVGKRNDKVPQWDERRRLNLETLETFSRFDSFNGTIEDYAATVDYITSIE
jgi:predicted GH43/DUF377 family glycosyl hydrolase